MPARSHPRPPDTASAATLDEVADELYGLAPEEFTAARTGHEKQARQAGDREKAAAIHRLAKPAIAAWLANQLVRERRDELQALPELGAGLRQATERLAGDELRDLSRQQHEVIYALVQQATELARASGHPVSEATAQGLEGTLHAALADQHAAERLLTGRLTEPLERHGFGDWVGSDSAIPVTDSGKPVPQRRQHRDQELRRNKHDVDQAERILTDAMEARDRSQARTAEAEQAAQLAEGEVEQLRRQLDEATTAASEANSLRRERVTELQRAERAVNDAQRRRSDAQMRWQRQAGGT